MFDAATTTLSSKGQVVIPEAIRERLGLKTGAQFVVVADRDVVILKVLEPPALSEFAALTAQARRAAKAAGLKPADVRGRSRRCDAPSEGRAGHQCLGVRTAVWWRARAYSDGVEHGRHPPRHLAADSGRIPTGWARTEQRA